MHSLRLLTIITVISAWPVSVVCAAGTDVQPQGASRQEDGQLSTVCHILTGPKSGQYISLKPLAPQPIGSQCTFGTMNVGKVVRWGRKSPDGVGPEASRGGVSASKKVHKSAAAPPVSGAQQDALKAEIESLKAHVDELSLQEEMARIKQDQAEGQIQSQNSQIEALKRGGQYNQSDSVGADSGQPGTQISNGKKSSRAFDRDTPRAEKKSDISGGRLIGTEFAGPNTYLGPLPTITLFLKPYNNSRNLVVCDSFKSIKTADVQRRSERLLPNVLALRWILAHDVPDQSDCSQLIGSYDYYRSGALLSAIVTENRQADGSHADISGQGPFIVEQFSDRSGEHYVFVDFSKADDADFKTLGPMIADAIAKQSNILQSNASAPPIAAVALPQGNDPNAANAKTGGGGAPNWVCGTLESPIARSAESFASTLANFVQFGGVIKGAISLIDSVSSPLCGVAPIPSAVVSAQGSGPTGSPKSPPTVAKPTKGKVT